MPFYTESELASIGLKRYGDNVLISNKVSLYHPENISLGNNVRIDDFCVLSAGVGGIEIGNYVHIAVFCSLIGAGKITVGEFAGLSSRVSIYSSNDDYSGEFMTNPMVPPQFTNITHADVVVGKHVIIGSGAVVLPGVTLEEGVAVGALSLIKRDCMAFGVYVGNRQVGERKRGGLELEKQLKNIKN